ncbi:outer membrane protein [Helicobacter baculiformis]|uniref:Outer membrane protein n=1 Tax=Helicobacter baculiformis TaxID=427351 RepID=A0ABV7ZJE6_9HELI|nr:outer membrane protein [Helicobacter baculiformis]
MQKRRGLKWVLGAVLGMGGLQATETPEWMKGLIVGASYQTGAINILTKSNGVPHNMNVSGNGLGLLIGYTGYFRDDQMLGARYYAFFDWQAFGAQYPKSPYGGGGYYGGSNLLVYGAAADFFYNFFQGSFYRDDISLDLGAYVGVGIAGNSWLLGSGGQDKMGIPPWGLSNVSVSAFQFLFNVGIRALIVGEHGIDLGFKIPSINNRYYIGDNFSVRLRRSFAFYIGYNYHF